MLFVEPLFFLFFAVVFAVSWSVPRDRPRKAVLLAASYLFYAGWDWRFLGLILLSTAVDFVVSRAIHAAPERSSARRRWLVLSLVTNLGILATFKYLGFFVDSARAGLHALGVTVADPALSIVLPVGISFYTFQTLSYTIDVFRGRLDPVRNVLDFALFVAFFPQLVAGPIVRAAHFLPQLARRPRLGEVAGRRWLTLFLIGFVKKACVADGVAPHVEQVFSAPDAFAASAVWLAVALYAIQIYCDFSGYSDMAIACAGLLGYDLGPNFRFPYLASSVADFWRRWHISLSTWLRDYLYIPLGGSRGTRWATTRNLMLTMLLGGLWHGAAWTFVAWGALHGVALAVHRGWRRLVEQRVPTITLPPVVTRTASTALTLWVVACGWILFRAESFGDAGVLLKAFVLGRGAGTLGHGPGGLDPNLWWLVGALFVLHLVGEHGWTADRLATLPRPGFALAYGTAIAIA
ncbi:MAG: MBOAT family O-acyltransferase, partial [Acidobacteriota bacterium]